MFSKVFSSNNIQTDDIAKGIFYTAFCKQILLCKHYIAVKFSSEKPRYLIPCYTSYILAQPVINTQTDMV